MYEYKNPNAPASKRMLIQIAYVSMEGDTRNNPKFPTNLTMLQAGAAIEALTAGHPVRFANGCTLTPRKRIKGGIKAGTFQAHVRAVKAADTRKINDARRMSQPVHIDGMADIAGVIKALEAAGLVYSRI